MVRIKRSCRQSTSKESGLVVQQFVFTGAFRIQRIVCPKGTWGQRLLHVSHRKSPTRHATSAYHSCQVEPLMDDLMQVDMGERGILTNEAVWQRR